MTNQILRQPLIGEPAPDFSLPATDGQLVHLGDYPKPVSLTFLRHLA
ncbi:MAG: hypothetical protein HY231_17175 [Acidobacteria bacterium]|nr:hypothetical protein [Acidobacteriota bacterium]